MGHGHRWLRLEALQQEGGVDDEGETDRHQGVHEYVEFRLPEPVLAKPFQDIDFGM